jgi:shikimate kinase
MKLYLIGLPGSGKSFLGRKLADEAKIPFIDLDQVIEQEAGVSISKIFSEKGEDYFRNLEAVALRKQSKAPDFVMACGGGTPCFHDNMKFINESGMSIFLNTALSVIIHRVEKTGQKEIRPLLTGTPTGSLEQRLTDMLKQRISFYRQANIILEEAVSPAELLKQIVKN